MTRNTRTLCIVLTLALIVTGQAWCATAAPTTAQTSAKSLDAAPSLSGKLVETMDVAAYTYLCLEENGTKTWFAVPLTKVTLGQEMTVNPGFEMVNFKSRELNRTFDKIFFSDGSAVKRDAADQEAIKRTHTGTAAEDFTGIRPASTADASATEGVKVNRASGANAFTVAELYEKMGLLDKQKVVVRAKVVKVSKGVMGKNWVHLRDGTGDAAHHTNNLVATTQDEPAVGDVVTAAGTIYKDKDFGSGYKYALIMEESRVKR